MSTTQLPAISHLSADAKKQLLLLLARDLMGTSGAPMRMGDATGEVVVYAPTDALPKPPVLSPERRAELAARLTETAVPVTDVIADLKRQAEQIRNQQS